MNLRKIGIVSAMAAAVLLPPAAMAGTAERLPWPKRPAPVSEAGGDGRNDRTPGRGTDDGGAFGRGTDTGGAPMTGAGGSGEPEGRTAHGGPDPARGDPSAVTADRKSRARQTAETPPEHRAFAGSPATTRCGPELASPEGVEAQTCVLIHGHDTWARTYYRNATGGELSSALALMGPGRRTVQINCVVEAGDEPGVCETPRQRVRPGGMYWAVAEFATADDSGHGPLLLRSGSNSADSTSR
ncbi:hypothetical protein ACIBCM_12680 [Streptomyces sp. NPDC051018]|uniref:hypothetical protein n=1 Tax=Streptomyces sp. NPDC051018 TaxID=3365639 RepID=UPI0037A67AD3